ncbi:hypothetical protein HDU98_000772 [Podochytrium sp. JEL0797]|nr:hypothetical protein HDU98_000772 [Podochytrium sp. JEL0797]
MSKHQTAHAASLRTSLQKQHLLSTQLSLRLAHTQRSHDTAKSLLTKLTHLRTRHRTASPVETEKAAELKQNAAILTLKAEEYQRRMDAYAEFGAGRRGEDLLEAIEGAHGRIGERLAAMQAKKSALKGFKDLPPDIDLAKMKLQERKIRLAALIEEKDKLLQSIMR